ncbi:hypothetical protein TSOC_002327, partial [Tetrabaena socialis]
MRSQVSGRSLDRSAATPQPACSCSYSTPLYRSSKRGQQHSHAVGPESCGRRSSLVHSRLAASRHDRSVRCAAASEPAPISGYTPANYISFSDTQSAPHSFSTTVEAPASLCFNIWSDWNRLVEFLDLLCRTLQIGLDPNNPDLALFQCFYRFGLMPVMEIVFVLQKTEVVQDEYIAFESVWGMPITGVVSFTDLGDGRTEVQLAFTHALPDLLVDLKVGTFGLQNSLRPILGENLEVFKALVEEAARDPSSLPPPEAPGERAYELGDEEADLE